MEPPDPPPVEASKLPGICAGARTGAGTAATTAATTSMHLGKHQHRWRAREGEKRTITVRYQPSENILKYLEDMRDALTETLAQAYALAKCTGGNSMPNPIALRRKVKPWFDSQYDYAKHHVNPLCRTAVALLKSYRKRHKRLAMPQVRRLAMRIDSELFRVKIRQDGAMTLRVTLKPFAYEYITFTPNHKKWSEYSNRGRASEILLTDRRLCLTFIIGFEGEKPLGARMAGSDLNFQSVDSTAFSSSEDKFEPPYTEPLTRILQVQNDFSRRRRRLQLHVRNPEKRDEKLKDTRGRQRNRVRDELHKLSTKTVCDNPDTSFVFENLKGIRRNGKKHEVSSKKLRTYLNRWPYRAFQNMVEYKSRCRTLYVSPRGTSSKCPVCGGKLKHPAWAISRCKNCGADYDRDRLASLAILLRGLRLCRYPFTVSADASWQPLRHEYLYAPGEPRAGRAGWTEQAANAPNRNADFHEFPHF